MNEENKVVVVIFHCSGKFLLFEIIDEREFLFVGLFDLLWSFLVMLSSENNLYYYRPCFVLLPYNLQITNEIMYFKFQTPCVPF